MLNIKASQFILRLFILSLALYSLKTEATVFNFSIIKVQDSVNSVSDSIVKKAQILYRQKNYKQAIAFVKDKAPFILLDNAEDSLNRTRLYYFKFECEIKLGQNSESFKSADSALKYFPKTIENDDVRQIKSMLYYKRAYGEADLGFENKAEQTMLRGLELMSKIEAKKYIHLIISGYVFLSTRSTFNRNFEDAKFYLRKAKDIYKNNKDDLAGVPKVTTDYMNRNEILLPAKTIYLLTESGKTKQDSLQIMEELEILDKKVASNSLKKSQSIYYTTSLSGIGDWYLNRKPDSLINSIDVERANYYITKALSLNKTKGYDIYYFSFSYKKARALTYGNELNKAYSLVNHLIDSIGYSDWPRNIAFLHAQKGLIQAKLKQKDSALVSFYKAMDELHTGEEVLHKNFDNFKPNKWYGETELILRIIERLQNFYGDDIQVKNLISPLYRAAFLQFENTYINSRFSQNQNSTLREIIQGLFQTKQSENYEDEINLKNILSRAETIINRLAWQQFYLSRKSNGLPVLDSLNQRQLDLRNKLVTAKTNNDIRYQDSINELINRTKTYTKSKFPNLDLLSDINFDIDSLQQRLSKDDLIIKYILLDNQMAILSIGSKKIKWQLKSWEQKDKALINEVIKRIKSKEINSVKTIKLSKLLLPEISEDIKNIVVNPDGIIGKIPFEILQQSDDVLLEKYNIRYTSNLGFIFPDIARKKKETSLAVYAPEYPKSNIELAVRSKPAFLEGAQIESKIISQLFPSNIYNGKNLTKQDFIETASQHKLLHLAMHATVNNDQPGLSRLLFSDDTSLDDDLYLEELYGLNLSADLAVLSACNTGIGNDNGGQGMESFQRAFTFAGVPSTLASLWEIPDLATKEIMVSFYKFLKSGQSKSLALKNAKLKYIKNYKNTKLAEPYYWAGFVLYGEDSPVVNKKFNVLWYSLIVLVGLFFAIVFLKKNRNRKRA